MKRCTSAFQTTAIVSGFDAIGIIDRDHWPDDLLTNLQGVHVLPVHEVESLYVLKDVYIAIATHLGLGQTADQSYVSVLQKWKQQASGALANKLICERFKARSLMLLERGFTITGDFNNRDALRTTLTAQIPATLPVTSPGKIWDEEAQIVENSIASTDPSIFLRVLPGKPLLGPAASTLGISKERYCELVKLGLGTPEGAFAKLHAALEAALAPYLPPRRAVTA